MYELLDTDGEGRGRHALDDFAEDAGGCHGGVSKTLAPREEAFGREYTVLLSGCE